MLFIVTSGVCVEVTMNLVVLGSDVSSVTTHDPACCWLATLNLMPKQRSQSMQMLTCPWNTDEQQNKGSTVMWRGIIPRLLA